MLSCARAEQGYLPLSCSAGTGGAVLPHRFRRTSPGLVLWGAESAFSKASLYKVRFTSNLGTQFDVPHKGLGPFCAAAEVPLDFPLCSADKIQRDFSCAELQRFQRSQRKYDDDPRQPWLETRECCKPTTVLQEVDGECDPAVMEAGKDLFIFFLFPVTLCLHDNK